ncbi:MAG: AAA family ATPase [Acidobacteria bacterium]|nr:AAA family ATPase [Acidobacteriota bacterium]
MIRRFTIEGFKRFEQKTVIDLDDVTVLVGANNSGKSTILHALTLFQYCVETTRRANGNGREPKQLALARRSVSPDEFGVLPVADPGDLWPNGRVRTKGQWNALSLRAEFDSGATIGFQLQMLYNRFSIVPSVTGDWRKAVDGREIRLIPIFSGFLPREEYLTLPARRDRLRLQRHGEMVRNLLWDLREHAGGRWSTLQELLKELFPESSVSVAFDLEVDRFLNATYRDRVLTRERDVMTAGSGFHQALQILASVLAPGAGTVLLDEPDAHMHARLQDRLMRILARLGSEERVQFILATHSPQLLNAAPEGAVRICMDGRVAALRVEPDQLRLLEELGAMDRMEIVPLLTSRAVVFVENKRDRNLLQQFARKHWGEKKQQDIWRGLTFLYTYRSPVDAGVLDLGRQVRDLLNSPDIASGRPVRMLAIGDRDYRTDASRRTVLRTHAGRAKTDAYQLDFKLLLWDANEIENYLLDRTAILTVLDRQADERQLGTVWKQQRQAFVAELDRLLDAQREHVRQSVATRIQQEDRRLALKTALDRADQFLNARWKDPERWCDAKAVLGDLRTWLQSRGLALRIAERDIIRDMAAVPADIRKALRALHTLSRAPGRTGRASRN